MKQDMTGLALVLALALTYTGACNQIAGIADYRELAADAGATSADAGPTPATDAAVVGLDASDGATQGDARVVADAQSVTPTVDANTEPADAATPASDAAVVTPPSDAGSPPPACVLLTVEVHAGPSATTAIELQDAVPPFVVTVVEGSKQVCLAPGTAVSLRGVGDTRDSVHTWQPSALCGGSGRRCDFTLQEPTVVSVVL